MAIEENEGLFKCLKITLIVLYVLGLIACFIFLILSIVGLIAIDSVDINDINGTDRGLSPAEKQDQKAAASMYHANLIVNQQDYNLEKK